jgi:hypothetical protein
MFCMVIHMIKFNICNVFGTYRNDGQIMPNNMSTIMYKRDLPPNKQKSYDKVGTSVVSNLDPVSSICIWSKNVIRLI